MEQSHNNSFRFNSDYRERSVLNDGTEVTLRLVTPADKSLLLHGMENFSRRSRYQRFLGTKMNLNDADLNYLTEIDGTNHFAIGALLEPQEGIGMARFVRFDQHPDTAEPAIAVVDDQQKKGLGKLLFTRLIEAARERGIHCFHGSMLADNKAMKYLLHAVGYNICFDYQGSIVKFDMRFG